MGRTEIAGFRPKSYKNLQMNARKMANLSNEIQGFRIVQAELILFSTQPIPPLRKVGDGTPGRPSVIRRVHLFGNRRFRMWQTRRGRCHQIASTRSGGPEPTPCLSA